MGTGREGGREGGSALRSFRWHSTHTRTGYMERYRHIGTSRRIARILHPACVLVLLQPPFCRPIHDRDARKRKKKKRSRDNPNPNPGRLNQQSPTTTTLEWSSTSQDYYSLVHVRGYSCKVLGLCIICIQQLLSSSTIQFYIITLSYAYSLGASIMHTLSQQSIRKYLFIYILLATVVYFYIIVYSAYIILLIVAATITYESSTSFITRELCILARTLLQYYQLVVVL